MGKQDGRGGGRLSRTDSARRRLTRPAHVPVHRLTNSHGCTYCSIKVGRPRAPSSPTAREMPRGVAVASIARLPSSTDDPSGSTADRHEPVEDWGSTRGHVHT